MPAYHHLVDEAVSWGAKRGAPAQQVTDRLAVNFGAELTRIVPGRVSTEVDADLSFDTEAMIAKAKTLIADYQSRGIGRERILIKVASTWEGAQAAAALQRENIDCNLTLLFSLAQAIICADAKAFLISPVRRPHPRLARQGGRRPLRQRDRPRRRFGQAHLRLLQDLWNQDGSNGRLVPQRRRDRRARRLRPTDDLAATARRTRQGRGPAAAPPRPEGPGQAAGKLELDEKRFRWMLNEDAMATEKLPKASACSPRTSRTLRKMVSERLAKAA